MKLINQVKKVPSELLSENAGYNPEEAEAHGDVQLADNGGSIAVEDEEGEIRHYSLVGAIDLLDYLNHYPQQFALFYKGRFYVNS